MKEVLKQQKENKNMKKAKKAKQESKNIIERLLKEKKKNKRRKGREKHKKKRREQNKGGEMKEGWQLKKGEVMNYLFINILHFQKEFGSKDHFNETNQGLWELAKKNGEETFQEDLKFDGKMRNNYWYQQPGYAAGKREHRLEEFEKYFKTL